LTISLLTTFALSWLVPRLPRFNALHPEIEVSLVATSRMADFRREDVDIAIRYGVGPWPDVRAEKLFADELTPLCGGKWIGKLKRPADLAHVPLLVLNNHEDWPAWLQAAGLKKIDPHKGQSFDSTRIAVDAAIAGAGVAIGNPSVHAEPIAEGRLFQPFDLVVPNGLSYWLVGPEATAERPKIRAFRNWLHDEIAAFRRPPSNRPGTAHADKKSNRAPAGPSRPARKAGRGTARDGVSGD
jgi:DNA-binding transcriptional LysR family regulator